MTKAGPSVIQIIIITLALSFPGRLFAQETFHITSDGIHTIDTSAYIPSFYDGALNYNLMIAASRGYISEITRLLEKGAEINALTDEGVTPLVLAVSNNRTDAVKTILSYDPLINEVTSSYETPLLIAVKNCNTEISELLIRGGAEPDYPDKHGATPLHHATIYGCMEIVDLLLYYDASIDIKTEEGITPFHASIKAGYSDISDLLIQHGANMEARDNDGFTPFLLAAYYGDTLLIDLLYKKGVDIYAVNKSNYNALSLSILSNQTATTEFLLRIGDKWLTSDNNVINPYSVVSKYRRKETDKLLKENNIPGNIKYGIDQVNFTLSSRFASNDFYSGISISLKEPYINGGFVAGFDTKLWYTRIMTKNSAELFYQYMDKGSVAYAGIFRDFQLTDRIDRFNYSFSSSLLAGYTFGNKLKGTFIVPENKFLIIPSLAFKVTKMNFSLNMGLEYLKTSYYKNGPLWARIGCSYNYFFDKVRTKVKPIKWY
jgi:ankyrin repeat protein